MEDEDELLRMFCIEQAVESRQPEHTMTEILAAAQQVYDWIHSSRETH